MGRLGSIWGDIEALLFYIPILKTQVGASASAAGIMMVRELPEMFFMQDILLNINK